MNRKSTSICLSAILAATSVSSSLIAAAQAPDAIARAAKAGGQAPPAASGGSGFAVKVAGNLAEAAATSLKQDLVKEGFTSAESRPAASGNFEVVIGGFSSRAQAETVVNELKGSGYTTSVEIVAEGGGTAAASPGTGQEIYRVQVAEFDSAAEATEASKVLLEERFVNVDIVEDNGKHTIMLGTFNREQDAQALLGDVNKAGFALASVVKREKLNSSTKSATTADLSSLPAAEQAGTRDVLAMAEKVESGEATADEVKQLREKIEQLTASQKAVVTQQESNRSAEQNKIQKTYPIYRQFEQALRAKNFEQAEQLLAQVQQINPNDIFLPGKQRVLEEQRSGGTTNAASPSQPAPTDPAALQTALNEARSADASGDKAGALQKYRSVVALDPTNVEARGKISELEAPAGSAATADTATGDDNKKMMMYGGAALAALVLLIFGWKKMKGGSKSASATPTPATGLSFDTSSVDPLASAYPTDLSPMTNPASPAGSPLGTTSGLAGADMSAMAGLHHFGEEEEPEAPPARKAPAPEPEPESESVSLEDMAPEESFPPATPVEAPPADDLVSFNFDDEPAPTAATEPTPSGKSAMDADLEALLRGTFPGAPDTEGPSESISLEDAPVEAPLTTSAPASSLVFAQDYSAAVAGSSPDGWRGEYDYATLSVAELDDAAHPKALMFEKTEGAGSATYHLSFPKASGKITAEFDVRCDEKNKFLLGLYFEKDEDFKQSIHTIIHQLDPSAPATLRIQGEGAPYVMGTWSHVRYEVDLSNGNIDAFMDNNHVVKNVALTVVPDYINTLSIRDNLATTGTLYIDNIRVSEA